MLPIHYCSPRLPSENEVAFVAPFYSAKHPDVYHTCGNCAEGRKIEPKDMKHGQVVRLCEQCARLQKEGRC
jgi:hypothetical protein